ncbi:hypothetical protein J5N97_010191 [Dioscorea zingiberensis]|uniref:Uncharacterized protein n=1 Tax=Dioscorea zingiberensis TaxID=325984 RepID=A0A9D5CYA0_9LILI|nr:hypothetical protein J5N97_010191 [Dioscorea zingiberensis]
MASSSSLCFMRPSFAAIALSLLLSVCYSFSFTFLSILLFFLLIFSNAKKLWQTSLVEKQKPKASELDGNENQAIQKDGDGDEDEDEGMLERLEIMPRPSPETEESDDENLIEITLPDGHYKAPEEKPETILLQQMSEGLMELLSDIIEEDNLIEIDINMGSIKCSRPLEMKA